MLLREGWGVFIHQGKSPSDAHLHPLPTLPCKHAPSSTPRGPRCCRGTPACRSTHSTPFPPLTPHPAGRWLTSSTGARTPHPPRGVLRRLPARGERRLCTEPESCRAALISRKHIISRNNISAPCRNPSPRRAHPASADKDRREQRAPPTSRHPAASDRPADPER